MPTAEDFCAFCSTLEQTISGWARRSVRGTRCLVETPRADPVPALAGGRGRGNVTIKDASVGPVGVGGRAVLAGGPGPLDRSERL